MAYMQRCSSTGSKYSRCVVRLLELYSIQCVPNFPQNRPNVLTVWQDVRNPVTRGSLFHNTSLPTKKGSRILRNVKATPHFHIERTTEFDELLPQVGEKGKGLKEKQF